MWEAWKTNGSMIFVTKIYRLCQSSKVWSNNILRLGNVLALSQLGLALSQLNWALCSEDIGVGNDNILSGVLNIADNLILRDCVADSRSGGVESVGRRSSLVDISWDRGNVVADCVSKRISNVSLAAVDNWVVSSCIVNLVLRNLNGRFLIDLHFLENSEKSSDWDESKKTANNNEGDKVIVVDAQRASCDLVVVLKSNGVLLLTEGRIEFLEEGCTEVDFANVLGSAEDF